MRLPRTHHEYPMRSICKRQSQIMCYKHGTYPNKSTSVSQLALLLEPVRFALELIAKTIIIPHIHVHVIITTLGHTRFLLLSLLILNIVIHFLLPLLLLEESFLCECLRLLQAIGDNNVIENSTRLDLPQLKPNMGTPIRAYGVHFIIIFVVGVVNDGVFPLTLVVRVGDPIRPPLTSVLRVVKHWGLPLTIILVIPILGLLRFRVRDLLSDVIISLRLLVLRVVHLSLINPVIWLGLIGILNCLGQEEVKLVLELP
mmetsp:Transcript_59793/g.177199  ORF Transcript_59793/g.177199 Transcript_59793/m.177199 type:complete len:257 (-) Transcript_59793:709-1479(-)